MELPRSFIRPSSQGSLGATTCFCFGGPGQGAVLYEQRVFMRPDWEAVLPPVVDVIAARADVDADKLILLGRSFGGYLAPRAAGQEQRFAALVVDPGQYDLGAGIDKRLPGHLLRQLGDDSPAADAAFENLLAEERYRRLFLLRMATHGATTVRQYLKMMQSYTNAGHAEMITCPTLICDNETDRVSTMQGQLLYDRLICPETLVVFNAAEGAEGHCQGLGQAIFFAACSIGPMKPWACADPRSVHGLEDLLLSLQQPTLLRLGSADFCVSMTARR